MLNNQQQFTSPQASPTYIVGDKLPLQHQNQNTTTTNDGTSSIFQYFKKTIFSPTKSAIKSDASLFDTRIFQQINLTQLLFQYSQLKLVRLNTLNDNNNVSSLDFGFDLGDKLIVRALKLSDFDRGYLKLLEQLTVVGDDVTREKFERRFELMRQCANTYFILVIEDSNLNKIIGSTTLVIEQKFLRHASARGRVEDVVVDDSYRGKRLGKLLLDLATLLSQVLGCYKVSLECKDELREFYKQFGYVLEDKQNYLCKRL